MMNVPVYEGERIDDLMTAGRQIIQSKEVFSFSMDAVLLARFVTIRPNDRIADLGTGNGVIPILLTTRKPSLHITAIEIQERLADMATRSVKLNGLEHVIDIIHGDLRDMPDRLGHGTFDVVVSNPPYRPLGIGEQNPNIHKAIAKHEIYGTLDEILQAASRLIRFGGKFAIVHRPDRLTDILYGMRKYSLEPKRMRLVYPKSGAKPNMVLIEAIRGGKPELSIEPPLIVYQDDGTYHPEIERLYAGGEIEWTK
jgi:tRNA1(Val) A37 N6-methylase TrmN6